MMITIDKEAALEKGLQTITGILINKMEQDAGGFFWKNLSYDSRSSEFSYGENNSIWNGTPGIVYYFLSLYEFTKQRRYLDIAEQAVKRILEKPMPADPALFNLFDGLPGIIYLLLKLFELSKKRAYVAKAAQLAREYQAAIVEQAEDDFLGGKAGNLYVMSLLYHYTRDAAVLEVVQTIITRLVNNARLGGKGIKWGRNNLSTDSLCGFSHGASGIAYALLQTGSYFRDPELIWLAEQALVYENQYYDPELKNWMDLRWTSANYQLPGLFEWERHTFRHTNFDVNAWAHGATGIGFARLCALQVTGKTVYKPEVDNVCKRGIFDLREKTKKNYVLFSGYGGIADFLVMYSQVFEDENAYQAAVDIALAAIEEGNAHGHTKWGIQQKDDIGLMTGTAGIGFLLLRVLSKGLIDSMLHPVLPVVPKEQNGEPLHAFSKIRPIIYKRYFEKTVLLLQDGGHISEDIFSVADLEQFENCLGSIISTLSPSGHEYVKDIFLLEKEIANLWRNHKGVLCFYTRLQILKERLPVYEKEDDGQFSQRKFIITPFIRLLKTKWNCKDVNKEGPDRDHYWNVLYSTDDRVYHLVIEAFPALILENLQTALTIPELLERLTQKGIPPSPAFTKKCILQVKELATRFFISESMI